MNDEQKPADDMSELEEKKQQRQRPVKKSPVKTSTTPAAESESYCQCDSYLAEELSVGCEICDLYWHLSCVGLKGLTESMINHLVDWRCPNCFVSPRAKGRSTSTTSPESAEVIAMRAIFKEELHQMSPVIKKNVEDAVRKALTDTSPNKELFDSSVTKAVDKAVKSYADITASSQKKVIEEISFAQASKDVVQQVVRQLDVDQVERKKKKLNVCVNKVPESTKKSPRDREKDDYQYCIDSLEIDARDIVSCHRAGKKDEKISNFCRPLIVKLRREEDVSYYTLDGRGFMTRDKLWINPDLCRADRKANFEARQEAEKRKKGKKIAEEKKEVKQEKKKKMEEKTGIPLNIEV